MWTRHGFVLLSGQWDQFILLNSHHPAPAFARPVRLIAALLQASRHANASVECRERWGFAMSAKPFVIATVLLMASRQANASPAPSVQQGPKLVGTGVHSAITYQGASVALSADGNTAIVGGYNDDPVGAAWVFTRSGGVWSQQGTKLAGTGAVGAAGQGISVALSADGNTAIVGGTGDNSGAGAAWVYTRSGGVWSQQGGKLVGTGALDPALQGYSVSLAADGNTAIEGGSFDNGGAGAAWVFTRGGGVWSQQGEKLVGSGVAGIPDQGISVGLSGDGNTAIIGGPGDLVTTGAAWVFTRSFGVWTQQGEKLVATGPVGTAGQGSAVALSSDGNTAIVGGPGDNSAAGAAWVWTRSGGAWSQQVEKLVGTGAVGNANQGYSVALSADGKTAILGGWNDNVGVGAAWVFVDPSILTVPPGNGSTSFVLAAPQPNPALGHALVSFALPFGQDVRLAVLDLQGREVALLSDGIQEAGRHDVSLDVSKLHEGMYFVRLRGHGVDLSRRLAVLK